MQRAAPTLCAAWFIAALAAVASVALSEARSWSPCHLCWYQRICLWPLVPALAVACLRRSTRIVPYVLPQILIGLLLAAYQTWIQEFVGEDVLGLCRAGPDCARKVDVGLGPVSIPWMSLAAFLSVLALLLRAWHVSRQGRRN